MARASPLRRLHQEAEASLVPYGPPLGGGDGSQIELVETFGELDLEYAAIRKACVLIDRPDRAVLEVTGKDRLDFLNRMLTQALKGLEPYQVRRTFWLNRKGRIDADLRLLDTGTKTILELDTHAAERARVGLDTFIVTEDARIEDVTARTHRLSLHGPTAAALLREVARPASETTAADLAPDRACIAQIAGHEAVVDRDDSTGEPGFELLMPLEAAPHIYQQLIETGALHDGDGDDERADPAARFRLRPAGWHAYNIARIEAGRPLYNIDFGPESLPHESGVLRDRVSFTKGCYLGQEVVARMESRGHSKRSLIALKCESVPSLNHPGDPRQPVGGAPVFASGTGAAIEGEPIGVVTSSAVSPMLGATPVCFAAVRPGHAAAGATLLLETEEGRIRAVVQRTLRLWSR